MTQTEIQYIAKLIKKAIARDREKLVKKISGEKLIEHSDSMTYNMAIDRIIRLIKEL